MAINYSGMKEEMIRALLKEERQKDQLYRKAYADQIMPTLVETQYNALTDEYLDIFSDGSKRRRSLNRVYSVDPNGPSYIRSTGSIDTVMIPDWIKSGEYVINSGLAKTVAQFVEKPLPVVEKSPEELMDDALDEAVRAARKAV